jgi:hypothetical protein
MTNGMLFAIGFFGTTILAVAISGTITTWTTGQVLKSSDLNTTITSLKTAIEGIPNWTKASNGTDAYYTAGNVGIGRLSTGGPLEVQSSSINTGIGHYNSNGDQIFTASFQRVNASSTLGNSRNGMATILASPVTIFTVGTDTATPMVFGTSDLERMRIASGGAVNVVGAL